MLAANSISILNCCGNFRFENLDFSGCKIPDANLKLAVLRKVNFSNCLLKGVLLTNATIKECNFSGADFEGCEIKVKYFGQVNAGNMITTVSVSPDGKTVASGSGNRNYGVIKLWNSDTLTKIINLEGHSDYIRSVNFSPDGKSLASGSGDKTIKLWSMDSFAEIKTMSGHTDQVLSVNFSPDGKILASGSGDN